MPGISACYGVNPRRCYWTVASRRNSGCRDARAICITIRPSPGPRADRIVTGLGFSHASDRGLDRFGLDDPGSGPGRLRLESTLIRTVPALSGLREDCGVR